jgi:hypothetical protein
MESHFHFKKENFKKEEIDVSNDPESSSSSFDAVVPHYGSCHPHTAGCSKPWASDCAWHHLVLDLAVLLLPLEPRRWDDMPTSSPV